MAEALDSSSLRRAIELAEQGRLRVEPNPCVGCVIVKGRTVVGEGYHAAWGGQHAEAAALRDAGRRARGATVYVTLEPCAHRGKTPPCTDALIAAGVAEVVYAAADPNPDTAGRGPKALREAGIKVRRLRVPAALRRLLEPYFVRQGRKRPWVIAKWAMTLDGRIASRSGDSKWITGDRARRFAHRELRGRVDALVVGAGTVRADDPALSNRSRRGKQPLRVVVCGRKAVPSRSQLLRDGRETLLVVPEHYHAPPGVEVLTCGRSGRVDITRMLRLLHRRGLERILVEGGGELFGSLFDKRCVDQVAVFVGTQVVGGISALSPVTGRGRGRVATAFAIDSPVHRTLGEDQLIEGVIRP